MIEDYPYSFKLRCKMRAWIETSSRYGQRVARQKTNPKKNNKWNKPTYSTYYDLMAMRLSDDGKVETSYLRRGWHRSEEIAEWIEKHRDYVDSDEHVARTARAMLRSAVVSDCKSKVIVSTIKGKEVSRREVKPLISEASAKKYLELADEIYKPLPEPEPDLGPLFA